MELESKYVFILNGIVAGFFGINFILAPRMIMEMVGPVGIIIGVAGETLGVHYGIALTTLAIFMLLIRNQPHSELRQNVFLFFILLWIGTFIYQLYMVFAFGFGGPMWILCLVLDILWTVLFVYQYYINMNA